MHFVESPKRFDAHSIQLRSGDSEAMQPAWQQLAKAYQSSGPMLHAAI